jgi:hypothetical protein
MVSTGTRGGGSTIVLPFWLWTGSFEVMPVEVATSVPLLEAA